MATVAEPSSVEIETRMQHAAAFNDEKIHICTESVHWHRRR